MKELNRTEQWIAEHAMPIFGTAAALVLAGAALFFYLFLEQAETERRVSVLEPKVVTITKHANFCQDRRVLVDRRPSVDCARRLRIALLNCRVHPDCRDALLAALKPPEGVIAQPPSHPQTGQKPRPGHRIPGLPLPTLPVPRPHAPAVPPVHACLELLVRACVEAKAS